MPVKTPRRLARPATPLASVLVIPLLLTGLLPTSLPAQQPEPVAEPVAERLRVFLDCDACDFDHLRREIRFVDYVRQPQDAQLHVLVTEEETGAGGERFTLFFIGRRTFEGRTDTLHATVGRDATDAEERAILTRRLTLGLASFAARTDLARALRIDYVGAAGEGDEAPAAPEDDPWNLWVFRTGLGASLEGESRETSVSLDGSLSASRTTEELKLDLVVYADYSRDRIEAEEDGEDDFTIVRRYYEAEALAVWSIGGQWSAGGYAAATTSSRLNRDLSLELAPALEYSLYPYEESTRRQILFTYLVGPTYYDYEEITLLGETRETLVRQTLDVSAAFRQPWGEIFGSLEASSYLDDFDLHRVELYAGIDVRLFRGFSLDVEGYVARIKDQIYLPAAGLTEEEILLGLRERGTDYQYELEVGFSYSFGSLFQNVVNPRMRGI